MEIDEKSPRGHRSMKRVRVGDPPSSYCDQIVSDIVEQDSVKRALSRVVEEALKLDGCRNVARTIQEKTISLDGVYVAIEEATIAVLADVLAKRTRITGITFDVRSTSSTHISALNDDCIARIVGYLPPPEQLQDERVCKQWHRVLRLQLSHLTDLDLTKYRLESYGNPLARFDSLLQLAGPRLRHLNIGGCRQLILNEYRIEQIQSLCPQLTRLSLQGDIGIDVLEIVHLSRIGALETFEMTTSPELHIANTFPPQPFDGCNCTLLDSCTKVPLRPLANCCSKCIVDTAFALAVEPMAHLRHFRFNSHRECERTQRRFITWLPRGLETFEVCGDIRADVFYAFLRDHGASLRVLKSKRSWLLAESSFTAVSPRAVLGFCPKLEQITVYPRCSVEQIDRFIGLRKLTFEAHGRVMSVLTDALLEQVCRQNPHLFTLRLGYLAKTLSTRGFVAIGTLRELRSLGVDRSGEESSQPFDDLALQTAISVQTNASTFEKLRLVAASAITDESLAYLTRVCPMLRKLYVHRCNHITANGMQALMDGLYRQNPHRRRHIRVNNCDLLSSARLVPPPSVFLERNPFPMYCS